jgi:hypothetical protein
MQVGAVKGRCASITANTESYFDAITKELKAKAKTSAKKKIDDDLY